ncbi:MAG: tetratricopeptide repeat protein [bacterium]
MSDDAYKNELWDFFKKIGGRISTFIAFVTAVVGFANLLLGNTGLVTIILLILGIGTLWLSFFYLYFKKLTASKWTRSLALFGIIAVPIFTLAGFVGWRYYQNRPSDKIIILVADFDGPDPQNYRVTETIIEQLREATDFYDDVEVKTLGETILAQQGNKFARSIGKEHKASIVLWGWYGKTEQRALVNVYFEVLQKPRGLLLRKEKQTLNLTLAELESFNIQTQLSGEMSYLTLLTLGLARYEAQDYDSALDCFTNALTQKAIPEHMINPAAIYFYRGVIYVHKGNLEKAISEFNQTITLQPDNVAAYQNRGLAYALIGDLDRAIRNFSLSIALQSDFTVAYYNRGTAYAQKGNLDQAIEDFNQAIALQPNYVAAYHNRGITYHVKGDYDRAIANYDMVIALNPDDFEAYYYRGNAFSQKVQSDSVVANYRRAIAINPIFAKALNSLAWHYAKRGENLLEALELSKRSLQINKKNPYYWDTLAEIYYRLGHFSDAKTANDSARTYASGKNLIKSIEERAQKIEIKSKEITRN